MVRTQVYIPDDQYNELKLMVAVGEGKFSDLIREGIGEVIQKRKIRRTRRVDPWKGFVGAIKGVKTNAVKDIQDYYEFGVVK